MLHNSENSSVKVKYDAKDEVLAIVLAEFHSLNERHFQSKLKMPVIEFSVRKTYGGYYQKSRHRIVLSWQAYVEHGLDETLNTFRHEVAHIVHQDHQAEFWKLAAALGVTRKFAAPPIVKSGRRMRWYNYQCPSCKRLVHRRRRIQVNSSCSNCDSRYNPDFRLELVGYEVR